MKKIISFSLYGNKPNFQVGAVVNVIEAKRLYPDWICRFYTTDDDKICKQLEFLGAEVIRMDHWPDGGMFWRFLAVDDADVCISRDCDSVVNEREAGAVKEWLEKDYQWHGMHDHKSHRKFSMMGGMWGYRHYQETNRPEKRAQESAYFFDFRNKSMKTYIDEWLNEKESNTTIGRDWDQLFLGDAIYKGKAQTNIMWHGSWVRNSGNPFPPHDPIRYAHFVGGYSFTGEKWNGFVNGDKIRHKEKNGVCLWHNLGLGDHIMMNGAVRYFMKQNKHILKLRLLCWEHNYNSVSYLYRNDPKIQIMTIKNKNGRDQVKKVRWRHDQENISQKTHFPLITWLFGMDKKPDPKKCWIKGMYKNARTPYSEINNFYLPRDHDLEQEAMEQILSRYGLEPGDKYAFVSTRWSIGNSDAMYEQIAQNTNLPIVQSYIREGSCSGNDENPRHGGGIFEWAKVIENASEIHTVDTSFLHLAKWLKIKTRKFFWDCRTDGNTLLDEYLNDEYDSGWERMYLD